MVRASAIVAQQVAAAEMNCDRPWGKPLFEKGTTGKQRVGTCQEPEAS